MKGNQWAREDDREYGDSTYVGSCVRAQNNKMVRRGSYTKGGGWSVSRPMQLGRAQPTTPNANKQVTRAFHDVRCDPASAHMPSPALASPRVV
jgi:hypothetical protein